MVLIWRICVGCVLHSSGVQGAEPPSLLPRRGRHNRPPSSIFKKSSCHDYAEQLCPALGAAGKHRGPRSPPSLACLSGGKCSINPPCCLGAELNSVVRQGPGETQAPSHRRKHTLILLLWPLRRRHESRFMCGAGGRVPRVQTHPRDGSSCRRSRCLVQPEPRGGSSTGLGRGEGTEGQSAVAAGAQHTAGRGPRRLQPLMSLASRSTAARSGSPKGVPAPKASSSSSSRMELSRGAQRARSAGGR